MQDLPLIDRIAQLFMIGFSGTDPEEQLLPLIDQHKLTSFILFERNVLGYAGMRSLIGSARKRARSKRLPPLLLAADEEGGLISPLCGAVGRLPSAMALAAGNSRERARLAAEHAGRRLKSAGLDLVLAPVLDVNREPDNPVIGTRSFGDNQLAVAAYGTAVITGFHSAGLLCCAKHFPGHGRTPKDSHETLPVVDASAEEMLSADLVPFYRACQLGVDAAMTAHVAYPALDDAPGRPSTLSKRIQTDILRNELKFKGTLISDSVEMKGLAGFLAPEDACVEALKAGVDMFICVDPHLALRCTSRLERALREGDLQTQVLERALSKVARLKERAGRTSRRPAPELDEADSGSLQATLDECYAASITAFNCESATLETRLGSIDRGLLLVPDGLPGYEATDPYLLTISLVSLGVSDRWQVLKYPFDPSDDDVSQILARVSQSDGIVLCSLSRGPEPPGQGRLAQGAVQSGKLVVGAALLDPYGVGRLFPAGLPKIASYGFWTECLRPLAEVLFGARQATGAMPVDIPGE